MKNTDTISFREDVDYYFTNSKDVILLSQTPKISDKVCPRCLEGKLMIPKFVKRCGQYAPFFGNFSCNHCGLFQYRVVTQEHRAHIKSNPREYRPIKCYDTMNINSEAL